MANKLTDKSVATNQSVSDYLFAAVAGVVKRVKYGVLPVSTSTPVIANSQIQFYLDEVGNKLKVVVKYSNGTSKSGEVALT